MKKNWKRKLCILIPIACFLLFAICFHFPIHTNTEITVCTLDGETAEIKIDVSFYRRFFQKNTVKGTVTWNGVKYLDWDSKVGKNTFHFDDVVSLDAVFSAANTLWHKRSEGLPQMKFLNAELPLLESTGKQIIFFDAIGGYNLEMVDIMYHDGISDENGYGSGVEYFGPANNQDEAQKMYQEFCKLRIENLR